MELHLKACRDIEFSEDGRTLFSAGKDLCIAITDVETEKLTRLYEKAHEYAQHIQILSIYRYLWYILTYFYLITFSRQPIYTMTVINEDVFATGDDDGVVRCNNIYLHF